MTTGVRGDGVTDLCADHLDSSSPIRELAVLVEDRRDLLFSPVLTHVPCAHHEVIAPNLTSHYERVVGPVPRRDTTDDQVPGRSLFNCALQVHFPLCSPP
jgi:hypothetical protein